MSQVQDLHPMAVPHLRKWLQFRLRTLLLVFVTGSALLAYWASTARRQHLAIAGLSSQGARIEQYEVETKHRRAIPFLSNWLVQTFGEESFSHPTSLRLPYFCKQQNGPLDLTRLDRLTDLQEVDARWSTITDADLSHFQELKYLESLDLSDTKITDAGLVHPQGLSTLEMLDLGGTRVGDQGLKHLSQLEGLKVLLLSYRPITDAGLKPLAGHKNLEEVSLCGTKITDGAIETIATWSRLQELHLTDTAVTDHGEQRLKRRLPQCTVIR
jgi:hypothetical protein